MDKNIESEEYQRLLEEKKKIRDELFNIRLEMSKNNTNSDIITNYDVLVNKDIETLSKFLACISCKNNYKLQDYVECFKEWLKQKSINDKRCSDLYFKIPESCNPTEA